jgi:holo-[acyl-carrier protein] synthase
VNRAPAPLIGFDLVEPDRLEHRLTRTPTLRDTLFTPGEVAYCSDQPSPVEHLAARLCAKEAVVKALGLATWDPLDIELVGGGDHLKVELKEDALEHARSLGVTVSVSLTHLTGLAGAVALALPKSTRWRVRTQVLFRSFIGRARSSSEKTR